MKMITCTSQKCHVLWPVTFWRGCIVLNLTDSSALISNSVFESNFESANTEKNWCKCKKKFKFKFKTTDTRRNWSVTHVAMKNKIGSIFEASLVSIAVWFITLILITITSKTTFVHLLGDSTTWRSDRFWQIEWKTLICQMQQTMVFSWTRLLWDTASILEL